VKKKLGGENGQIGKNLPILTPHTDGTIYPFGDVFAWERKGRQKSGGEEKNAREHRLHAQAGMKLIIPDTGSHRGRFARPLAAPWSDRAKEGKRKETPRAYRAMPGTPIKGSRQQTSWANKWGSLGGGEKRSLKMVPKRQDYYSHNLYRRSRGSRPKRIANRMN